MVKRLERVQRGEGLEGSGNGLNWVSALSSSTIDQAEVEQWGVGPSRWMGETVLCSGPLARCPFRLVVLGGMIRQEISLPRVSTTSALDQACLRFSSLRTSHVILTPTTPD